MMKKRSEFTFETPALLAFHPKYISVHGGSAVNPCGDGVFSDAEPDCDAVQETVEFA